MLCVWLGVLSGYTLGFLLANFAGDFAASWYPGEAGEHSFSPTQVAQGRCVANGSVLGMVAGIAVTLADAIYQSRKPATTQ